MLVQYCDCDTVTPGTDADVDSGHTGQSRRAGGGCGNMHITMSLLF